MKEERGILLPVYFVADESLSMEPFVGDLNAGIHSLHEALLKEPLAASKVRLSIVGFAGDAISRLELSDVRELAGSPRLMTRPTGTCYGAAFADLLARIPADQVRLRADGYRIHRPVVFFLTDGMPTDGIGWQEDRRRLTDKEHVRAHPNIIAFGIGEGADAANIHKIASKGDFALLSVPGADMGKVIAEFIQTFVHTVIESGSALASGSETLVVKKPDPSVMQVAADVVPDLDS